MSTDGVLAAAYLPYDGYLDPSQLTFALADGARRLGAEIETRTHVTGDRAARRPRPRRRHRPRPDRVRRRRQRRRHVRAGDRPDGRRRRSRSSRSATSTSSPSRPIPRCQPLPTLRDPDNLIYFRTEVGGLVMGGYERNPASWALDGIPPGFEAQLLAEDWDRMEELMTNAIRRVPALETLPIKRFFNGPEAFTPDAEFILGESEVPGFWVAAGFCAHGLAGAGGIGKTMAEWIVDGQPEWEVWALDIRRFGGHYGSQRVHARRARTRRSRSTTTSSTRARRSRPAGRCASRRPTRATSRSAPPSARSRAGSASTGTPRTPAAGDESLRPRGWAGENWSPAIARRGRRHAHRGGPVRRVELREARGARARARSTSCSGCCANDVDRPVGRVTYTQMLNARGGIECDLSVIRTRRGPLPARHRHRVRARTTGAGSSATRRATARSTSATSPRAAPASASGARTPATILQPLTKTSLAHADFPYMSARELAVGDVPCLARARDVRRRARLGALLPDGVRRGAVGRPHRRRRRRTAWCRAATARSTRCGSRRATAPGRPTSRPTRRPTRPASASP